jgi:hypothetical protein
MFGNDKETGHAMIANPIMSKTSHCMPGNEAFEGKLVQVIERNPEGDCLCLEPKGKTGMATIDASDVLFFIPMKKDQGNHLVPTNMTTMEEINWMAMVQTFPGIYNAAVLAFATTGNRVPKYSDYKAVWKLCESPTADVSAIYAFMLLNGEELRRAANA